MNSGTTPITVLMPIRDGQAWIHDSITSLLTQDYQNFEILVVDDGSTDHSIATAMELGKDKVRVIKANGEGLAKALALGVTAADTELIARMDVDDVAHHTRLKRQTKFLERHSDHVLIGSNVTLIDDSGRRIGESHFPLTNEAIRKRMAIGNPFAHSAVMFRKSTVLTVGNYFSPSAGPYPEDYQLWSRLLHVGKVSNIDEPLISYRVNTKGVSQVHRDALRKASASISWKWYAELHPHIENPAALQDAWQACFGESSRISLRQAAMVSQAMFHLEFPGLLGGGKRGLRLRHYAIPLARIVGRS